MKKICTVVGLLHTERLDGSELAELRDNAGKPVGLLERFCYMTCHRQENTDAGGDIGGDGGVGGSDDLSGASEESGESGCVGREVVPSFCWCSRWATRPLSPW